MDAALTIDVERDLKSNGFKGIFKLRHFLKKLEKRKIFVTLFVTGEILEKFPRLFKNMYRSGHEIGIHGYSHKRYDLMNEEEKINDLKKSIFIYYKIFGKIPAGFRAPQHSLDFKTRDLLNKEGIKYDASLTPGNILLIKQLLFFNKNFLSILRHFFYINKKSKTVTIKEIPRFSFLISQGAFELKVFGPYFLYFLSSLNRLFKIPLVFTMHSWDFIEVKNSRIGRLCTPARFDSYLFFYLDIIKKRFLFTKMEELYEKTKNS